MTEPIGYAPLQIIPTLKGLSTAMDKQLAGLKGMGRDAGKQLGEGIASGVDAASKRVEQATRKIEALRDKEAAATDKVAAAEARINEVREKGGSALKRAEAQRNAAQRAQASALRDIERETKQLTEAQKDLAKAQDDVARGGSEAGEGFLSRLKGLRGDVADAGNEAATGFVEGFGGPIATIGTKGGPIGLALAAAAGITIGAGALIAKNVIAGMEQEAAADRIQAQLGLSDEDAARIGESAGAVYTANFGASFADVQQSMADVASTIGASSPALEDITQKALTFRDVFGTEVSESVAFAQNLIVNKLAPDASGAFDLMSASFQRVPAAMRDEFPELLSEYNQYWSGLGFSGEQAFGLMVASADKGKIYLDKVGDTLKEVSLLATEVDNNDVWGVLHETLGLDPSAVANNLLAGGPQAQQQFQELVKGLAAIPDRATQAEAALKLFGTPMEDLGKDKIPEFLDALAQGTSAMDGFEGSAQRMVDTTGDNPLAAWESAMRGIETAGADVQATLGEAFGPLVSDAADWVSTHQPEIIKGFSMLAVAGISFGEAIGTAGVMALRALEGLASGMGNTLGVVLKGLSAAADLVGADGLAADLHTASEAAFTFGDGLGPMADGLQGMVDGLGEAREGLNKTGNDMIKAAEASRDLNDNIELLPDQKTIVLEDNTPEAIAAIDKTKYAIEHLPDGEVKVIPLTDEAKEQFDALVGSMRTEPPVPVEVEPKLDPAKLDAMRAQIDAIVGGRPDLPPPPTPAPDSGLPGLLIPPPPRRATGGMVDPSGRIHGPGTGTSDSILAAVMGGHGGLIRVSALESINTAASTRANWPVIDAMNAGANLTPWFKTLPGFAAGGAISSAVGQVNEIAAHYGLELTSGRASRENETKSYHSSGQAGDFSNGVRTDAMLAFATYMAQTYGSQLAELIYDDPRFGMEIKDGKIVDRSFYAAAGNHTNHVHVALKNTLQPSLGNQSFDGAQPLAAPGVGPNGESGTYTVDPREVRERELRVAEADAKVRESEAQLRELEADAKESDKIRAQANLEKSKNDAEKARYELAEAQRGKFSADKSGGDSDGTPLGLKLPSAFSGLASIGLDGMGFTTQVSPNLPKRTFEFGNALGAAVGGQLSSALDVLGVGDSPGWLQGLSTLVGGISIGGGGGSAAPLSASTPFDAAPPPDIVGNVHGTHAGMAPGPVFNTTIQARDAEGAMDAWRRLQNERAAAKLGRY